MNPAIKTPQTHPDHEVVGKYFGGHSIVFEKSQIYFCDSYDPALGYWMTNIDPKLNDRRNVSERAIGRTFYRAEDRGIYWWITQWGAKVESPVFNEAHHKAGLDITDEALRMFSHFYKELRPFWTSEEYNFVTELVFGYAALPLAEAKYKIIMAKIEQLNLLEIAQSFRTTVRFPLTDKEVLWLTMRYVDAYESPK